LDNFVQNNKNKLERTRDLNKIIKKINNWESKIKNKKLVSIIVVLVALLLILGIYTYKKNEEYRLASENSYNMSFYQLVDYVQNVETYLAKSLISSAAEQGAETLSNVWREANLANAYLTQLPIESNELQNTAKFLNQVSDYSYSLSRKNIKGENLTQNDMKNLEELHQYSIELENTLNQLSMDINDGKITWGELTKNNNIMFAQQVSNISKDSFGNLEENFHEYSGLIYDGAFSEHITRAEKKGLTGENIDEETAKNIAKKFIGEDKIQQIESSGKSENGNIVAYSFNAILNKNEQMVYIAVAEKGGHIVYMDSDREVLAEAISQEQADKIGKEFLEQKGLNNMKETYYLKQDGIVTINYAYSQDNVTIYPDLIKLKIALDDGEILGIETTGYLNSHTTRDIAKVKVSKEDAKKNLDKNLEIKSENLAIIPTEWKTEILCWEFKGTIDEMDFLVYVNVETGKVEDILLIVNTPNGTLTH